MNIFFKTFSITLSQYPPVKKWIKSFYAFSTLMIEYNQCLVEHISKVCNAIPKYVCNAILIKPEKDVRFKKDVLLH